MNEDKNNDLENNSAFDLENNSYEVKESLFERVKNFLTRPRLGSGNNVRTTNMDFNSWNMRAVFRRAMENVSTAISNVMGSRKESEVKNGFQTTIIGKESNEPNMEKTADKFAEVTADRVIPQAKSKMVGAKVQAKGIIDNAKSAEDIALEEQELGIEVADINVDDMELEEAGKTQVNSDNNGIEVTNIIVDSKPNGKETRSDDDERIQF